MRKKCHPECTACNAMTALGEVYGQTCAYRKNASGNIKSMPINPLQNP